MWPEALARNAWYARSPGFWASSLSTGLIPVSLLYAAIMKARRQRYLSNPSLSIRINLPVICVGNLTLGGSGKTPTTLLIARLLMDAGKNPAIISRGYRGTMEGRVVVVSDGRTIFHTPREVGDEPVMMARRLGNVPVLIGAKRTDAAKKAIDLGGVDCLVLDDAYQHLSIARDLNILCVAGERGFGNGRSFPSGPLREPLGAAAAAQLCLVNHYGPVREGIEDQLRDYGFAGRYIEVPYTLSRFESLADQTIVETEQLREKPVVAFCSIAHAQTFFSSLQACGIRIVARLAFADHHVYSPQDIAQIGQLAKGQAFELFEERQALGVIS